MKTQSSQSFISEDELQQRAHEYAQKTETLVDESNEWVVFSLGDEYFALHLDQLDEITALQPGVGLPGLHVALMGLINLRGVVLLLVDSARALGLRSKMPLPDEHQRILIVVDERGNRTGLLVDRLINLSVNQRLNFEHYEAAANHQRNYIDSVAASDDLAIARINLPELLESIREWAGG
jgi:purine-binding chemotaxis protein CheW